MMARFSRFAVLAGICGIALVAGGCGGSDKKSAEKPDVTSESAQASSSEPDYESYAGEFGLSVKTLKRLNENGLEPSALDECDPSMYPYDANDGSSADDTRYYLHCVTGIPDWEDACVVPDSPDIASSYETSTGLDVCQLLSQVRSCRNGEFECDTGDAISDYLWVPDKKLDL